MEKRKWLFYVCVLLLFCVISCREDKQVVEEAKEEKPDKLVVYINGVFHGYDDDGWLEKTYPTEYMVGPKQIGGIPTASGGNVFQQALEEYENKTGIDIEIHYLDEYGRDERYALQELYEEGNTMPDLVIASKHHQYDYYNLAKQGLLLDLTPYTENDGELQDDEQYYQRVLDAGKINDSQYIIPLTFNLNALVTSERYLQEIGMTILEEDITYDEVMYLLKRSCEEMTDSAMKEAIYESSGSIFTGQYIMSILLASAHSSYFDSDIAMTNISVDTLISIYDLMKAYIQQEYNNVYGYEDMSYTELRHSGQSKTLNVKFLSGDQYDYIGIFLTGGRGGGVNVYHNILSDAAYFHSMAKERGDSMVFVGIPTVDDSDAYSANVDSMMFSFSSTEYPEAVYGLMKYLLNYSFGMEVGLSINRSYTEQQLEDIQNTFLMVYADDRSWDSIVMGYKTLDEIKDAMEQLEPLDAETVDQIRYMLDHMEGAELPYYSLEYLMFYRVLLEIGNENMTPNEAALWTLDKLQERMKMLDDDVLFYDPQYDYEILGWDLQE